MPIQKVERVKLDDLDEAMVRLQEKHHIIDVQYPNDSFAVVRYETRGNRATGDMETRT